MCVDTDVYHFYYFVVVSVIITCTSKCVQKQVCMVLNCSVNETVVIKIHLCAVGLNIIIYIRRNTHVATIWF